MTAATRDVLRAIFMRGPEHIDRLIRTVGAIGLDEALHARPPLVAIVRDYAHLTDAGLSTCIDARMHIEKEAATSLREITSAAIGPHYSEPPARFVQPPPLQRFRSGDPG